MIRKFLFLSDRKLQPTEFPHNIYIQNYSTATATCIVLKKWVFSPNRESFLNSDTVAVSFLYGQVSAVNFLYGQVSTVNFLYGQVIDRIVMLTSFMDRLWTD